MTCRPLFADQQAWGYFQILSITSHNSKIFCSMGGVILQGSMTCVGYDVHPSKSTMCNSILPHWSQWQKVVHYCAWHIVSYEISAFCVTHIPVC